jgi:5-formyltetrahydrofolate cyclo-ligase
MSELKQQKRAVRKRMKSVIAATTPQQRRAWSEQIAAQITGLSEWDTCQTVLAFLPRDGEVDTVGMIELALSAGKTVGVPRMHSHHIEFHRIESIDHSWDHHPYGLREPPKSLPIIDPCAPDAGEMLVITPGLCFDSDGRRLGFGRGYYDRFVERCRNEKDRRIFFAAVCFAVQLIDRVPAGPHDRIVDAIFTEHGLAFRREPAGDRG